MGEIEKLADLESQNLGIKNCLRNIIIKKYRYKEISISLVKISLFRMKKFEINKLIKYETVFQQSVFEMSCFDIFKAKKISFKHCLTPKNLSTELFHTKKSHLSMIYYQEIY